MKWEGERGSDNVEDRRGKGGFRFPFPRPGGGGGFRFPSGGGRFPMPGGRQGGGGLIGIIIVVIVLLLLGVDPRLLLEGGAPGPGGPIQTGERRPFPAPQPAPQGGPAAPANAADPESRFAAAVLKMTEDVWNEQFQRLGRRYSEPVLVIYEDATRSGCGLGQSQMGPFYCPLDQRLYLDLSFFRDLSQRFRAPGDFARAYVIAHEVGHHVQTLLGVTEKVMTAKQRMGQGEQNALQVRMELQADCFAGLWAHHANAKRNVLESGDLEEALNAASAIGDDRLQRQAGGRVAPDSFTHGSSAQRMRWFKIGFDQGRLDACDTFRAGAGL
ncbi:MAG: neutral zinc metallopeptidase [Hyphomicrobiales bacterium]|nr:neutral zinc metallopeptidase [Hyphomicrobiales bacterium]